MNVVCLWNEDKWALSSAYMGDADANHALRPVVALPSSTSVTLQGDVWKVIQ